MPSALDAASVLAVLRGACAPVIAAHAELSRLDAVAGDGDLGESLAAGYTALEKVLAEASSEVGISGLLRLQGTTISRAAPSTLGTLLGMAWRDAGAAVGDAAALDSAGVVRLLQAMADGVARRGQVEAGQRTVLDGLLASVAAASQAASGDEVVATWRAAAEGARAGADATAAMRPQVGRAGWIGERAQGHPDAGATAWAVIAEAMATAMENVR